MKNKFKNNKKYIKIKNRDYEKEEKEYLSLKLKELAYKYLYLMSYLTPEELSKIFNNDEWLKNFNDKKEINNKNNISLDLDVVVSSFMESFKDCSKENIEIEIEFMEKSIKLIEKILHIQI